MGDIICIRVGITPSSLSIDVIKDYQPVYVIQLAQPTHYIPNNGINIASTYSGVHSATLCNLTF